MEFIDTPYFWLAPLLIVASFFAGNNKKYLLGILAAVNYTLVFHSVYVLRQMIGFYHMAMAMLSKDDLAKMQQQPVEWTWDQTRMLLVIILPLFFFIKKLSGNIIFTLLFWVVLFWDTILMWYNCMIGKQIFYFSAYLPYDFTYKLLGYISLVIALYSLLWLVRRLPWQGRKSQRHLAIKS